MPAIDTRCRDQFVRSFGQRAFRRPLTDAELDRYTALFTAQTAQTSKSAQFLDGALRRRVAESARQPFEIAAFLVEIRDRPVLDDAQATGQLVQEIPALLQRV